MSVQVASDPGYRAGSGGQTGPGGGRQFFGFNPGQTWAPAVNLYETERAYVVCVDLSGVDKEKIDVELQGQVLAIKGERAVPTDFDPDCLGPATAQSAGGKRCKVHVMEIDHGAFSRAVELPTDADKAAVSARYREGLLWIDVPKRV